MPYVALAERTLTCSRETAFDKLADYPSWDAWMPDTFRPVGRSRGALGAGDAVYVRIDRMPLPARILVAVARRPEEITWCGGVKGVLWAEHRFLFEPGERGGTRVRSVETWHGPLARLLRRVIQPRAERIGSEQLAGLARGLGELESAAVGDAGNV